MQKITTCREQGRQFLGEAFDLLDKGDLQQASEKGWSAASQMLKAVAQNRGWSNSKHRDIYQVVWDLMEETGDEELSGLFGAASSLHTNFYDLTYPAHYIRGLLRQVERLVDKTEALLNGATQA